MVGAITNPTSVAKLQVTSLLVSSTRKKMKKLLKCYSDADLVLLFLQTLQLIYLILGNSLNWWKGGGDGNVHSKVVAPAPQ